jgi:hypothetical protein
LQAHKLLEVSDICGGLSHAAIHYFSFNQQLDDITFENGNLPGPQSSNMLAELVRLCFSLWSYTLQCRKKNSALPHALMFSYLYHEVRSFLCSGTAVY